MSLPSGAGRPSGSLLGKRTYAPDLLKKEQTKQLPWIEKYRPKTLQDLVAHEDIISTIQRFVDADKLPHLLFYGPPGTGKTSTVLAVAREMYGENLRSMVLELNASDARGIDTVREEIKTFAGTRKLFSSGVKLIILDEADNMTKDAQNALRRVIEKFAKNCRFCLICNYASKIIPAIQSRCTRFRFAPLRTDQVIDRVKYVIEQEQVDITDSGLQAVLKLGRGDMRKVLNILQSASLAHPKITDDAVYQCAGKPTRQDVKICVNALMNESFKKGFEEIQNMQMVRGIALLDIVTEVFEHIMAIRMPKQVRIFVVRELAELEYRLAFGTEESVQLGSLVGIFHVARQLVQNSLEDSSGSALGNGDFVGSGSAATPMEIK